MAVPVAVGTIENARLGLAIRDVERELHFASPGESKNITVNGLGKVQRDR